MHYEFWFLEELETKGIGLLGGAGDYRSATWAIVISSKHCLGHQSLGWPSLAGSALRASLHVVGAKRCQHPGVHEKTLRSSTIRLPSRLCLQSLPWANFNLYLFPVINWEYNSFQWVLRILSTNYRTCGWFYELFQLISEVKEVSF